MSVNLIQNPNGGAATFNLGHDFINPYGKIIVPKNDNIGHCVPLAQHIFDQHKAFKRVDLTHDAQRGTVLTVNLITINGLTPPDFWNQGRRNLVQHFINDFFSNANKPAVNLGALQQHYTPQDRFDVGGADKHVSEIFNSTSNVLSTLAQNHGGDFEFINMEPYEVDETGRSPVVTTVSVFGACAGCGSFEKTYGHAPEMINKKLSSSNPYYIHTVQESETHKGGMVFKR